MTVIVIMTETGTDQEIDTGAEMVGEVVAVDVIGDRDVIVMVAVVEMVVVVVVVVIEGTRTTKTTTTTTTTRKTMIARR